jgi:hypothetical protein
MSVSMERSDHRERLTALVHKFRELSSFTARQVMGSARPPSQKRRRPTATHHPVPRMAEKGPRIKTLGPQDAPKHGEGAIAHVMRLQVHFNQDGARVRKDGTRAGQNRPLSTLHIDLIEDPLSLIRAQDCRACPPQLACS